ncbi:unnamed protein product, partial [Aphanomyces euteiches]
MNQQTFYIIQQSNPQDQSMTWIFLALALCIALLCMQINGTVTINIKWNPIHTLTQIANNGGNVVPSRNEESTPPTSEKEDKTSKLLSRIQELERALDAARENNDALEAQRQSLQRICHVLVQQEEMINN